MMMSLNFISQQTLFRFSINLSIASLALVTSSAFSRSDLNIVLKLLRHMGSASQIKMVALQPHRDYREACERGWIFIEFPPPVEPNSVIGRTGIINEARLGPSSPLWVIIFLKFLLSYTFGDKVAFNSSAFGSDWSLTLPGSILVSDSGYIDPDKLLLVLYDDFKLLSSWIDSWSCRIKISCI